MKSKTFFCGISDLPFCVFIANMFSLIILWLNESFDKIANNVSGFHSHKESRANIYWLCAQKGCYFWQNEPEQFPKWYLFFLKLCTQQMSGCTDFSNPYTNMWVGLLFGAFTQEVLKLRFFWKCWLIPRHFLNISI